MHRKIIVAIVLILLLVGGSGVGAVSSGEIQQKIDDTRRERDALLEEQKKLQAELEQLNAEGQNLQSAVRSLDATRRKLLNDIKITNSKVTSANKYIKGLENSINDKEKEIALHQQALISALQQINSYDSESLVEQVLLYDEVSLVWRERGRLDELNDSLGREIEELNQTRISLGREKTEKEEAKKNLLSLHKELKSQKGIVEESKGAKSKLLIQTKNKESEYQKLLAQNIARQKQFEAELYKLESGLHISIDDKLYPDAESGLLSWPLDNIYVTQRFGKTIASKRLYASGTHNGVDFRAGMGTPVKAVLSGTVSAMGNTDEQKGCYSYGRWILIDHGDGLSTIYAHLSASLVSKGQAVNMGSTIGYSGGMPGTSGAGYSTGPHLHLGLFATQGVKVRQFTTSQNCQQVYVPIASPESYLDPLAYLPGGN